MSSSIIVIARLVAHPQHTDALRAALDTLIAATRQEPGCLRYELNQDLENPAAWVMYEIWQSQAALEAHNQTAHMGAFLATAKTWLQEVDIRRYQPV